MTMAGFFHGSYLFFVTYFVCLMAFFLFLLAMAFVENKKRIMQHRFEDYGIIAKSEYTKPVSVLISALNEERTIANCVKSALNLDYPEFEIIVVNDGSSDRTLSVLANEFSLEARDVIYNRRFNNKKIKGVYRSRAYPNLTVIDKDNGDGKAGGLNVAMDFSTYGYICATDADTILERDALLKAMRPVLREPDTIVGVCSLFGILNGFTVRDGRIVNRKFSRFTLQSFQMLEYIRSFIYRLAWGKMRAMLCVSGGFAIWRKDFVYEIGGYSSNFTCEDMELTFRAHDHIVKNKMSCKIEMLPYIVAWTEGPNKIKNLISQRNRWQRVTNETFFHYRHMLFNPRYGAMGLVMMVYMFLYEVVGVFFEVGSWTITILGLITGYLAIPNALLLMSIMISCYVMATLISIYIFDNSQRQFSPKDLRMFIAMSFLEFLAYRPILSIARLFGTIDFIKKDKKWDRFDRVDMAANMSLTPDLETGRI